MIKSGKVAGGENTRDKETAKGGNSRDHQRALHINTDTCRPGVILDQAEEINTRK